MKSILHLLYNIPSKITLLALATLTVIPLAAGQNKTAVADSTAGNIIITDIMIDGSDMLPGNFSGRCEGLELKMTTADDSVCIKFASGRKDAGRKLQYEWRLKGADNRWHTAEGDTAVAIIDNPGAGHYTFEVRRTDRRGETLQGTTTSITLVCEQTTFEAMLHNWATWAAVIVLLTAATFFYTRSALRSKLPAVILRHRNRAGHVPANNEIKNDEAQSAKLKTGDKAADDKFMNAVKTAITDRMSDPDFNVDALAAAMNMSRSSLNRKLKRSSGQTPQEMILSVRLQCTEDLLIKTDTPINEIVRTLGYSDLRYFAKVFKSVYGMTPQDYRKQYHITQKRRTKI